MDRVKKELLEWGQSILIILVFFLIYNYFFVVTTVYNTSMYPTLMEKDMIFMVKVGEVSHGDIVSYRSHLTITARDYEGLNAIQKIFHKEGERKNLIKRVIAVPGDSIAIEDGKVFVNGMAIDEPYISSYTTSYVEAQVVPQGKYFMMGDNRSFSSDSRDLGLVDEEDIIGRAVFRVMPIKRFGQVN